MPGAYDGWIVDMDVLFIMIPLGLVLVAFGIWSFVWSVKHDQFEDLERQGWSILFEDETPAKADDPAIQPEATNERRTS